MGIDCFFRIVDCFWELVLFVFDDVVVDILGGFSKLCFFGFWGEVEFGIVFVVVECD